MLRTRDVFAGLILIVLCGLPWALYSEHQRREQRRAYDERVLQTKRAWKRVDEALSSPEPIYQLYRANFQEALDALRDTPSGREFGEGTDYSLEYMRCELDADIYRSLLHILEETGRKSPEIPDVENRLHRCLTL